ncbi:protein Mso1p [Monosporozyma unispora]|nr:hypothetical protein C6P44_000323 [Kazachstania unispora]
MPLASECLNKNESDDIWSKLKTSTKQLSSKTEKDGDSITSTVVHESIVRYYKKQEPFQGFPGWLGHKEDLPDEQKILRKQNEQIAKQAKPSKLQNFKEATSEYVSTHSSPIGSHRHSKSQENQSRPSTGEHTLPRRRTAGMGFRAIYQSKTNEVANLLPPETSSQSQPNQGHPQSAPVAGNSYANMSNGPQGHHQRPSWTSPSSQSHSTQGRPNLGPQTSSDLMSARLKGRTNRG